MTRIAIPLLLLTLLLLFPAPSLTLFDPLSIFKHHHHKSSSSTRHPSPNPSPSIASPLHDSTPSGSSPIRCPPCLLLFLFAQSSSASPLNPQAISVAGPFFQGWLLRTTDHTNNASVILIIGSFSLKRSNAYNEHYLFCGLNSPATGSHHFEEFPSPSSVSIQGNIPESLSSRLNITWTVRGAGSMRLEGGGGEVNFAFPSFSIRLRLSDRVPWLVSSSKSEARSGPEGWLAHTSLLPCHYAVHSVGSCCEYDVSSSSSGIQINGHGHTHIEGNHGSFFPDGWIWAQAISPLNRASFSLVGGRFVIAGISPINWVLYLRTTDGVYIFRTTDLDTFKYAVKPTEGTVRVEAISFGGKKKVVIEITSAGIRTFSPNIHIPTATGFSNTPGCRETYTATATATVYCRDRRFSSNWGLKQSIDFPLTALEFGALFQTISLLEKC